MKTGTSKANSKTNKTVLMIFNGLQSISFPRDTLCQRNLGLMVDPMVGSWWELASIKRLNSLGVPLLMSVCFETLNRIGVMDMLRFHKFTIGHAWTSDYGNPDDPEDYEILLKYSPLHNVRSDVPYPAVLITTGDHDDRVVPLHSLKFLAALQEAAPNNPVPIVGRIETKAGHGAGKSTQQIVFDSNSHSHVRLKSRVTNLHSWP